VPFVLLLTLLAPIIWPQDGVGDTFRFWYAGHLVATGESPYDQLAWAAAGETYGVFAKEMATACAPGPNAPVCLWPYPPTTALLFAPFGFLGVREGLNALATFFVTLAAASVLVVGVWMRALSFATRALAMCACVVSHPFVFDVHAGHFEGLGMIGIVLLAVGLTQRRVTPVVVGALLLAMKPHLYIGLAVIVLLLLLRRRDWRTLGWTVAVVAALNGLALVLYPEALGAMVGRAGQVFGLGWATTWAVASSILPSVVAGLAIVYAIAAAAFVAAVRFAPSERREDVLIVGGTAVSLMVSPYVQPYDFLVLFPAVAIALTLHERVGQPTRGVLLMTTAGTLAVGTWLAIAGTAVVPTLPGLIPVVLLALLAIAAWAARSPGATLFVGSPSQGVSVRSRATD
jgi:hypothetical protein